MSRIIVHDLETVENLEAQELAAVYGGSFWSSLGGILQQVFTIVPVSTGFSLGGGWSIGIQGTSSGLGISIGNPSSGIGFGFSWSF